MRNARLAGVEHVGWFDLHGLPLGSDGDVRDDVIPVQTSQRDLYYFSWKLGRLRGCCFVVFVGVRAAPMYKSITDYLHILYYQTVRNHAIVSNSTADVQRRANTEGPIVLSTYWQQTQEVRSSAR